MALIWGNDCDEGTAGARALDTTSLTDRFEGDVEMLSQLSEVFLEEYPRQLSAVREAVRGRDAAALARSSHMLKGSVGIFGAEHAAELAEHLESSGRTADLAHVDEEYRSLEGHVVHLAQLLTTLPTTAPA